MVTKSIRIYKTLHTLLFGAFLGSVVFVLELADELLSGEILIKEQETNTWIAADDII